jgi:hypothetical protein
MNKNTKHDKTLGLSFAEIFELRFLVKQETRKLLKLQEIEDRAGYAYSDGGIKKSIALCDSLLSKLEKA